MRQIPRCHQQHKRQDSKTQNNHNRDTQNPKGHLGCKVKHKKTRHALGHGSFWLGTYDARSSCIPLKCSQAAMLLREDRRDSLASAVDPRLFDPRDRDDRPEITPQGVQQTYVHGRVISTAGLSKPAPLTVIVVRVYSLPQGN